MSTYSLFTTDAPLIHVVPKPIDDRVPHIWPVATLPSGAVMRRVRGKKMRIVPRMFDEFAAALQFPPYFGENWAAFDECLADLDWLRGTAYTLVVWDAEELLVDSATEEFATLLRVLDRVASEWSRPVSAGEQWDRAAVPFHTVLVAPATEVVRVRDQVRAAGVECSLF
jgi:hypothetical protein